MPGNDLIPWLQSLMQNQGAPMPGGATLPGSVGGGTYPYPAATPGGPSMGYPAQGGPDIFGPQGSNIGTGKEVGPWTNPFTDAHINPQTGQPEYVGGEGATIGPGSGAGGGFNPLNLFGGNPYARGAIAAAGVMTPTPAETGELPLSLSGARPQHPASTGAMPDPATYPHMPWPGSPPPQTYPHMPWPPNADNSHMPWPDTGAPTGSPSATPKPAGPMGSPSSSAAPMKRTPGAPNLGYYQPNNRFVQVDRPNASAAGGFGRGGPPQMTALNLAGLFGGRGQPAAAVNPANVPAANAQPVSFASPPVPGPMAIGSPAPAMPPKRPPGLPYWPFKQQGYSP